MKPNVIYFHVDNLGYGELGCYGGGVLRGADTRRIDQFASEGFQLLNFAPEAQCTPSRTALLTGRHAIRTGNHTVAGAGAEAGIVAWERTLGDMFADERIRHDVPGQVAHRRLRRSLAHRPRVRYLVRAATLVRRVLWETDPWYVPGRDPVAYMLEGRKGETLKQAEKLTFDLKRNVDVDYKRRAFGFMEEQAKGHKPFFLYFNHSLMHIPVVPRDEYKGKSGNGDWADCLLQLDGDFGELLDKLDALGLRDNTIVVFAGDNGNEEMLLHRGTAGFFEGSYFTGMEASLRTPCIARWPGRIAAGRKSNEIVHITDWFTTLLTMAGLPVPRRPRDRRQGPVSVPVRSAGEIEPRGIPLLERREAVRSQVAELQAGDGRAEVLDRPGPAARVPAHRQPDRPIRRSASRSTRSTYHTWTLAHFGRLMKEFAVSVKREPLIPSGAPLDFVPKAAPKG